MLPLSAVSMRASVGGGFRASRAATVTIRPDWQ
jgi:hypothetical protein